MELSQDGLTYHVAGEPSLTQVRVLPTPALRFAGLTYRLVKRSWVIAGDRGFRRAQLVSAVCQESIRLQAVQAIENGEHDNLRTAI